MNITFCDGMLLQVTLHDNKATVISKQEIGTETIDFYNYFAKYRLSPKEQLLTLSNCPDKEAIEIISGQPLVNQFFLDCIRQIFTWYDQGKSMTEIVNQLNAQGAVNAAGKPFIISVMRRILTNKMYIGIRLYKGEDIGIRVPAIIDKELFDRVQIQVGKNKCAPARNKPLNDQYLLTTKLFCAQCGSTMSGISGISKNGSKYQYYSCTNRSNKKGCTKRYIGKEVLETAVVDTVKKVLLANNIPELAKAVVKCCNDAQDNGNLLKLESELREVNKGIPTRRAMRHHTLPCARSTTGGIPQELLPA